MEDIGKKFEGHGQKKRIEEKTTPSKRIQKLGNVSLRQSVGRKTKAPSAHLVRWATLLTAAAVAAVSTAGGKCIVVPSGSEGNRKQK